MRTGKNKWRCVVGLTGGIGSGKSTVLAMFRKKGAFTLDADAIVHKLLATDNKVLKAVRNAFGNEIFTSGNKLNKKELAKRVFTNTKKKKALERILHPRVREQVMSELVRRHGDVAIVDVPLLYESGWQRRFDKVIVVDASLKYRLTRLKKKGFDALDVKRRVKAQWPLTRKVRLADFVVNNNGSRTQTKKQIDQIWKKLPIETDGGF